MLILISDSKLPFNFTLNQSHAETLEGLRESFIELFGKELFGQASKIVVVENHFYNVIKDRYGPSLIGEHIDNLQDLIDGHLDV